MEGMRKIRSAISRPRVEDTFLEQGIDEGRDRRPLRQHNQGTKQEQNDENRQQPELFPFFHKGPQFHQKTAHTGSFW